MVKLLLDRGPNVNAKGPDGYTALMEAARYGRFEITELLLERGADAAAKPLRAKQLTHLQKKRLYPVCRVFAGLWEPESQSIGPFF